MPVLGSPHFWLIMFIVVVGGFISASAGSGFAIVLVAALQFFMEPVELIGVITTLGCVGTSLRKSNPPCRPAIPFQADLV